MAIFNTYGPPGLWHTPAYQSSGEPWITGSAITGSSPTLGTTHQISFPKVTRSFTIINTGSSGGEEVRIHFNSGAAAFNGVGGTQTIGEGARIFAKQNYITVAAGASLTMNVKCKEVYVSCRAQNWGAGQATGVETGYQIFAELTAIGTASMYNLTGSGISGPPL